MSVHETDVIGLPQSIKDELSKPRLAELFRTGGFILVDGRGIMVHALPVDDYTRGQFSSSETLELYIVPAAFDPDSRTDELASSHLNISSDEAEPNGAGGNKYRGKHRSHTKGSFSLRRIRVK